MLLVDGFLRGRPPFFMVYDGLAGSRRQGCRFGRDSKHFQRSGRSARNPGCSPHHCDWDVNRSCRVTRTADLRMSFVNPSRNLSTISSPPPKTVVTCLVTCFGSNWLHTVHKYDTSSTSRSASNSFRYRFLCIHWIYELPARHAGGHWFKSSTAQSLVLKDLGKNLGP
jgi:hypothetical protein